MIFLIFSPRFFFEHEQFSFDIHAENISPESRKKVELREFFKIFVSSLTFCFFPWIPRRTFSRHCRQIIAQNPNAIRSQLKKNFFISFC